MGAAHRGGTPYGTRWFQPPIRPQAAIFNYPFSIINSAPKGRGVPPAGGGRIAMRATYQFLLFLTACGTPYVFPKFQ